MRRLAFVLLLAACGDQKPETPFVEVALIPASPSKDLDLLFVLDDTTNLDMQVNLKLAFPVLVSELTAVDGTLPNIHLGVVTSDLGTKGYLDAEPGDSIGSGDGSCAGAGKAGRLVTNGAPSLEGDYIVDVAVGDGARMTNYTGTLDGTFAEIASVGAKGCGFEQPLEAMRLALGDPSGPNAGFLRPNARLAVVTLQDEDDCSFSHSALLGSDVESLGVLQSFRCTQFGVTCDVGGKTPAEMAVLGDKADCHGNESSPYVAPVTRYVETLASVKPDPRNVLLAVLAGPSTPVVVEPRVPPNGGSPIPALGHACPYTGRNGGNVADPAVRMADLVRHLRRGVLQTVCEVDLSSQLHAIGRQVRNMLGDTCLPSPIVGECRFFDETPSATRELPPCSSGAPDCYQLVEDASCGGGVRPQVTRSTEPPADTMTSIKCPVASSAP